MDAREGFDMEYIDLQGEIGAFDIDPGDTLIIDIQMPSSGELSLSDQRRDVPSQQSTCSSVGVNFEYTNAIPCGLSLPSRLVTVSLY